MVLRRDHSEISTGMESVLQFRQGPECDVQVSAELWNAVSGLPFNNVRGDGERGATRLTCESVFLLLRPFGGQPVDQETKGVGLLPGGELLIGLHVTSVGCAVLG